MGDKIESRRRLQNSYGEERGIRSVLFLLLLNCKLQKEAVIGETALIISEK